MDTETLHDLRRRILDGEEPTKEELRAAIEHLQPARLGDITAAAEASAAGSKKRASKNAVSLDDLL